MPHKMKRVAVTGQMLNGAESVAAEAGKQRFVDRIGLRQNGDNLRYGGAQSLRILRADEGRDLQYARCTNQQPRVSH
jgi:uncharacterized ParB-like nuclease family protein